MVGIQLVAFSLSYRFLGFPGGSVGKESACNAGDQVWIPGLGRSPGEGSGYPFQYSCLENSIDKGAWRATDHGVTNNWTGLSDSDFSFLLLVVTFSFPPKEDLCTSLLRG